MRKTVVFIWAFCLLVGLGGCAAKKADISVVPLAQEEQLAAIKDEADKRFLAALKYWKKAQGIVDTKISSIAAHLQEISQTFAEKGKELFDKREGEAALYEFIEALRYDPSNEVALQYLTKKYTARNFAPYTVKPGDTFATIADAVYGNESDAFAVARFSGVTKEKELVAGSVIHLPLLKSFYSQSLLDYKRDILVARNLFNEEKYANLLPLAEKILKNHPGDQEALYLYNSTLVGLGNRLRSQENYEDAAEALSRVDPTFKNVKENIKEIRELQRQKMEKDASRLNTELFRKGEILFSQQKYLAALEMFREVDPDFEGVEAAIAGVKEVMRMQADIHYKNGVKFFVEDNLAAAIKEWEKTLGYDPDHDKAKSYIAKAMKLLEKYKAIN